MKELIKWMGPQKALWFLVAPFILVGIGAWAWFNSGKGTVNDGVLAGWNVWLDGSIVWVIYRVLLAIKGFWSGSILPNLKGILVVVFLTALFTCIWVNAFVDNGVATSFPIEQSAKQIAGIPNAPPLPPTKEGIMKTFRPLLPDWPGREDCLSEYTDSVRFNKSSTEIGNKWGQCFTRFAEYKAAIGHNTYHVDSNTLVLLLQVIAVLGIIASVASLVIPGVGKFSWGVVLFTFIAFGLWITTSVESAGQDAVRKIFQTAFWVRGIELVLAFVGLGITALGLIKPDNKQIAIAFGLALAATSALIGLNLESIVKVKLLTDAVAAARGTATLDQMFFAWEMGSIGGASLFGLGLSIIGLVKGMLK